MITHLGQRYLFVLPLAILFLTLNIPATSQPNTTFGSLTDKIQEAKYHLSSDEQLLRWFEEKAYLSIAASSLSPQASNSYNQAGWWMLNYPVALKYKLRISAYVDERYDWVRSTRAARDYFRYLENKYEEEAIADLAFITSPLLVSKYRSLIDRELMADTVQNDPERLLLNIQKEKLIAAQQAYERYYLSSALQESIYKLSTVKPSNKANFKSIAKYLGITVKEMKRLNPVYIVGIYEPGLTDVPLRIPQDKETVFKVHEDSIYAHTIAQINLQNLKNKERIARMKQNIPDPNATKLIVYKIKSGDNLSQIAKRYHARVRDIKRWNNLKSSRIYSGKTLKLYVGKNARPTSTSRLQAKKNDAKTLDLKEGFESYTIKKGDTLWSISRRYPGVSPDDIMKWNRITPNIRPGEIIHIKSSRQK